MFSEICSILWLVINMRMSWTCMVNISSIRAKIRSAIGFLSILLSSKLFFENKMSIFSEGWRTQPNEHLNAQSDLSLSVSILEESPEVKSVNSVTMISASETDWMSLKPWRWNTNSRVTHIFADTNPNRLQTSENISSMHHWTYKPSGRLFRRIETHLNSKHH